MELFTWPCGCKSPAAGGEVVEQCEDCKDPTGLRRFAKAYPGMSGVTTAPPCTHYAPADQPLAFGQDAEDRSRERNA